LLDKDRAEQCVQADGLPCSVSRLFLARNSGSFSLAAPRGKTPLPITCRVKGWKGFVEQVIFEQFYQREVAFLLGKIQRNPRLGH